MPTRRRPMSASTGPSAGHNVLRVDAATAEPCRISAMQKILVVRAGGIQVLHQTEEAGAVKIFQLRVDVAPSGGGFVLVCHNVFYWNVMGSEWTKQLKQHENLPSSQGRIGK